MQHFLVTFDPRTSSSTTRTFRRPEAALRAYEAAEEWHRGSRVQVVLLGASSLDEAQATHPNLFEPRTVDDLVRDVLQGLTAPPVGGSLPTSSGR